MKLKQKKGKTNMKTYLLAFLAAIAPLLAAIADYALFTSGYPPAQEFSAATGTASVVVLGMQMPRSSSISIALDSRFRTTGLSNTSKLSSFPPGSFIAIR